jgi:hypothetical protein
MDNIEKEITELHQFFESWYRGELENTEPSFSRLADVLAAEFALVTPDGHVVERQQLLDLMRTEYATKPEIKIWIENCRLRFSDQNVFIVIYEEHGIDKNRKRVSLITAVLQKNQQQVNGLEWVHISEVHLPSPETAE